MKKYVWILFLAILLIPAISWAEYQGIQEKNEPVATLVLLQNDWIKTAGDKAVDSPRIFCYWQSKVFGGGFETVTTPKTDCLTARGFGTMKLGDSPFSLVAGAMSTSYGSDYVHGGFWSIKSFGKFWTFFEVKEYTRISAEGSCYLDSFLEINHPVCSGQFSIGVVSMYDHWWDGSNHDWFFIGPIGYYNITSKASIFCRPSYEWDRTDGETTGTAKLRFGLKLLF